MSNENVKLNFLHICDYASFDQVGKLNILGIFENINSIKFPYQHPQFFVVANISIPTSEEYECVLRITNPENVEISKFTLPKVKVNVNKGQSETNIGIVGQFNGIKFDNPGQYKIEVLVNSDLIDSKEIKVSPITNIKNV